MGPLDLEASIDFSQALLIACYVNMGVVPRATELIANSLRDGIQSGERNLRFFGGNLVLLSTYMKTRHMGQTQRVPRALPQSLAELMIAFFALVRPLENMFSVTCSSPRALVTYDQYLWVQQGVWPHARIITAGLNELANTLREQYPYRTRITVRMWRQTLKAFLNKLVIPQTLPFIPLPQLDIVHPAIDYGFGHSKATASAHYGVNMSAPIGVTPDMFEATLDIAHRWHVWSGVSQPRPQSLPMVSPCDNSSFNSRFIRALLE